MKQYDESRSQGELNKSATTKVSGPQTRGGKYYYPPKGVELLTFHAEDIMVDELDMIRAGRSSRRRSKDTREGDPVVEFEGAERRSAGT
jgi:hypothetical protein